MLNPSFTIHMARITGTVLFGLSTAAGFIQAAPSPFPIAQAKYDQYRKEAYETQKAILQRRESRCTWDNVIIRKEWLIESSISYY